jgi:hypothetical protein
LGRVLTQPLAQLLSERTAPELTYLETKWAALIPYRATSELLADVLPLDHTVSTSVLRHLVHKVAQRMEGELGEEQYLFITPDENEAHSLPDPAPPLTVGLDSGYVHSCEQPNRQEGWFEVIVGKSITTEGDARCVAFVHKRDSKPKRRIVELLKSQGAHANQPVMFLSDGEPQPFESPNDPPPHVDLRSRPAKLCYTRPRVMIVMPVLPL